ncbi:substrate-binding and VWA domain-containing protein [Dermacoccaceae bacterium W4C1]
MVAPISAVPNRRRAVAGAGLAALMAVGGSGLVRAVGSTGADEAGGCITTENVSVITTNEMIDQVRKAADLVQSSGTVCATYDVKQRDPGAVADDIVDGTSTPDVWIPDSKVWADNVNAAKKNTLVSGATLATSPVVMAVPKSLSSNASYTQPRSWSQMLGSDLPVAVSDPNQTTSSLVAIIAANQSSNNKTQRTDLLSNYLRLSRSATTEDVLYYFAGQNASSARIFPTSEQRLASYNESQPSHPLTAVVPEGGAGELAYTWVTPRTGGADKPATDALLRQLTSPEGRSQMAQAGLRVSGAAAPEGTGVPADVKLIGYPSLKDSQGAQADWRSMRQDARMLVLVDVSGSMSTKIEGRDESRVQTLVKLASGALDGLPPSTAIGAWAFSTNLDGKGKDYLELAPEIKPASTPGYKQELKNKLPMAYDLVRRNGDTGLYDSISAAYTYMQRTFDPDYVNSVVVLTDGKNDDPDGGIDLQKLVNQLRTQNGQNKVKVVTIAIGDDTDPAALQQITSVTDGKSYMANTPDEITQVFLDAFLRRGE